MAPMAFERVVAPEEVELEVAQGAVTLEALEADRHLVAPVETGSKLRVAVQRVTRRPQIDLLHHAAVALAVEIDEQLLEPLVLVEARSHGVDYVIEPIVIVEMIDLQEVADGVV